MVSRKPRPVLADLATVPSRAPIFAEWFTLLRQTTGTGDGLSIIVIPNPA